MTQQMPTREQLLAEAQRRGLIPTEPAQPTREQLIQEAMRRGLIGNEQQQAQTERLLTPQEMSAIQSQLGGQAGEAQAAQETGAGEAFLASAGRQFAKAGRTLRSGLARIGEDDEAALAQIERERQEEARAFAPLEEQRPISTTAGEITGAVAATAPVGGPVGGLVAKTGSKIAPRLAPVLGFAAAGAVEEQLLEGNPLLGAAFGAGGGVLFEATPKILKAAYQRLTGNSAEGLSDIPEEIIVQLEQSGISMEDLGKTAEDLLRRDLDVNIAPEGQARQARAREFGAELTSAQATKDFSLQEAEDMLRKSGTPEGAEATRLRSEQEQAFLRGAEERLLTPFQSNLTANVADKSDSFNRNEIGNILRSSLKEVQSRDKQLVDDLYQAAREIPGEGIPVEGQQLASVLTEFSDFAGVSDTTQNALLRNLAKFGVLGEGAEKQGLKTVVDFDGQKVSFSGDLQNLTVDNAEELRKAINQVSTSNAADMRLKVEMLDALDNAFGTAVQEVPEGTAKREAFEKARTAFSEMKDQYEVGDIISNLLATKDAKGNIPLVSDEEILNKVIRTQKAPQNIRRLKQALLTNPTPSSTQAWNDFQMVAMEDFLKRSLDRTTDASGNITYALSGNRLMTNLDKMGAEQAKLIFGPEMTATLKRLTQSVGDATIPVKGAVNPSESGTRVANTFRRFLSLMGDMAAPGGQTRAEITSAIRKGQQETQAQRQLQEALASVRGQRLPRAQQDAALINWMESLGQGASARAQGLQAPATAGAALAPEQE